MTKLIQFFDYMFYCTYHFLIRLRNTNDRASDVAWAFSSLFSFPMLGFIFIVWGLLFAKGFIDIRPLIPVLMGLSAVFIFTSLFLIDNYFTKNNRYQDILKHYGAHPSRKHIILGSFFFILSASMILIVGLFCYFIFNFFIFSK